jgi:hypothetical protein
VEPELDESTPLALNSGQTQQEQSMGGKPSNSFQSDRPESGGADKDGIREKNGLLDRDKEKYASDMAKREEEKEAGRGAGAGRESRN